MIKKGSTVKIHYTLKIEDQTIDSSSERGPITFVQGDGQIVPGVEKRMEGLEVGEAATGKGDVLVGVRPFRRIHGDQVLRRLPGRDVAGTG